MNETQHSFLQVTAPLAAETRLRVTPGFFWRASFLSLGAPGATGGWIYRERTKEGMRVRSRAEREDQGVRTQCLHICTNALLADVIQW